MSDVIALADYLARWVDRSPEREAVAKTVDAIAGATVEIDALIRKGPLAGAIGATTGKQSGVDQQKKIDVLANDLILDALRTCPVSCFASEEMDNPLRIHADGKLAVAVDPIDGSSNVEANITLGTIFSILPALASGGDGSSFMQPGHNQLAAGFAVYGPYTSLVVSVGAGTQIFTLDPATRTFIRSFYSVAIPALTSEFAINSSNYRHWEDCVRIYVDDLLRGRDGPRGKDFNMRWTATPVSDIYRILMRGGIFLYPSDLRDGYTSGRLRLVYEANPLAFIIEQAGGGASTGRHRILDVEPRTLHQHTPIVAGSKAEVDYVVRLHHEPHGPGERSPLFGRRGLFRT
ncbi:MAG: class 1 fructose-bisphosphatase [Hyphomicrobium sp.]